MARSFDERVSMKQHRRRAPAPDKRAAGSLIVIRRITIAPIGRGGLSGFDALRWFGNRHRDSRHIVECCLERIKRRHRFAARDDTFRAQRHCIGGVHQ
ncbi:TPA: hypothetical protein SAY52_003601 [Burkholderia cenocepacia]|uniref:hypothetical protein n=1 Tax=unclassified Burkholderia TaxID=2613784 RepID=UPI00158F05D5|nr:MULTISPECIES: hypothetical protein [unclassified Burkholderia]HEF5872962.1 hypothetical protein [Burkholderia cenocepacia]